MAKPPSDDAVGRSQWRRIAATVQPLRRKTTGKPVAALTKAATPKPDLRHADLGSAPKAEKSKAVRAVASAAARTLKQAERDAAARKAQSATQLDGTWERQLRGGRLVPDMTIDLHGHQLASAHTHLARALDRAVVAGARVLLVIAGKARGPDEAPRGAIRRELESWLAHSRHAPRIAAVRGAHPRHGGAGAVYIILRRPTPAQ